MDVNNWYEVLELEFDPPEEREELIAQRLLEKKSAWTKLFNDPKWKVQAQTWLNQMEDMERDMIGEDNRRAEIAKVACENVYGNLDSKLKRIGTRGEIPSTVGENMAKSLNVTVAQIQKRCKALGLRWVEAGNSQERQEELYQQYYKKKSPNTASFQNNLSKLSDLKANDYYDFLYQGTPVKNPQHLPCEDLLQRATERLQDFKKNNVESSTGKQLCNACKSTFATMEKKAEYDLYLQDLEQKSIFKDIKALAKLLGGMELDLIQSQGYIDQLSTQLRQRSLAEEVFYAFCVIEKIPVERPSSSVPLPPRTLCRCGVSNDVSDGRAVCVACGLDLVILCPQCGAKVEASAQVCKCRFVFAHMDQALALAEEAQRSLDSLDFALAQSKLDRARTLWDKCPTLPKIQLELSGKETQVGAEVSRLRHAMEQRRFVEAKTLLGQIQKQFPQYQNPSVSEEMELALSQAEKAFALAREASSPEELLEHCTEVLERCQDYPGIQELLPKPRAVENFTIEPDGKSACNRLRWRANSDRSVSFELRRSSQSWVQSPQQGELVFEGSGNSYNDQNIQAGTTYYYNVYAKRLGVYSPGAVGDFSEVVNLFEISSVQGVGGNGSVSLTWAVPPSGARVEVYLEQGGKRLHLQSTQGSGTLLNSLGEGKPLSNGKEYQFYLALSYEQGGKRVETPGQSVSVTANCPPLPVDSLRLKPCGEGGKFEALWYPPEEGELRLYGSEKKPTWTLGEMVSVTELEQQLRELQTLPLTAKTKEKLKSQETGCSFVHSGEETLYVVAVVVQDKIAVMGNLRSATLGESVELSSVTLANGKLALSLTAPSHCRAFVLLYRFDQYPEDMEDKQAEKLYISGKQFQTDSCLLVPHAQEKPYYFSVYGEFVRDGDKDYSLPGEIFYDNRGKTTFVYRVSLSGLMKKSLKLSFTTEEEDALLPAVDFMLCDTEPMFKENCSLHHSQLAEKINGTTMTVELPYDKGMKGKYLKPYFQEEASYGRHSLKLDHGSSHHLK